MIQTLPSPFTRHTHESQQTSSRLHTDYTTHTLAQHYTCARAATGSATLLPLRRDARDVVYSPAPLQRKAWSSGARGAGRHVRTGKHVLGLGRERFGFSVFYPRWLRSAFLPMLPTQGSFKKGYIPIWVGTRSPSPCLHGTPS
jgi:hypothetical protein